MPDGERSFAPDLARLYGHKQVRNVAIETKAVESDDKFWTLRGRATSPRTDRMGDVVEPQGARYTLPIPLLLNHQSGQVVGNVVDATKTKNGIDFVAKIPKIKEDGTVKTRVEEAVHSLQYGLIRSTSIGFNPERDGIELIRDEKNDQITGLRFTDWEWLELSLVPIPANPDAKITQFKSLATAAPGHRRASGPSPGASGTPTKPPSGGFFSTRGKEITMKGIPERLAEREGQRAEKAARVQELTEKCGGDFDALEAMELAEFDGLNGEVRDLDTQIERLRGTLRAANAAKAIPTDAGTDPDRAHRVRGGDFQMKSNLPKGTLWTRATIMKARAIKMHMSLSDAADWARKEWPDTPEVALYIKANPGTGASGNWAEPLNAVNTVDNDFIALLRPATIIGKLPLRPSPFNVKMIRQTGGSTVGWVGKAAAKPVSELAYDTVQVDQSKVAGIIVLTDDQIMTSHIDSVEATRMDLVAQIAQFADEQFTDPSVAAVSGTNPASVTNGVSAVASGGATADDLRADLHKVLNRFTVASIPLSGIYFVMSSFVASGISMLTNSLGQPDFPDVTVEGGRLRGFPVIVSDSVGGSSSSSNLIAVKASEVLLAQNGGVRVDMSRDATIDMAGGNSPTFSLFQKNAVALRAEWWVSWQKARAEAVQYISGAAYAPANP